MEVLRPGDAVEFLRLAGALLERDEARNQLPLGIAGNLIARPGEFEVVRFWVVRDRDEPVAVAVRTEPFNLVLGDPSSETALGSLLEAVVADDPEVPGIVGNVPFVEPAAERLADTSGRTAERVLSEGVYRLTAVRDVARAPGEPRPAGPEDRGLLLDWLRAFVTESLPDPDEVYRRMERTLDSRFGSGSAGFWFWEDGGEAVSLAGFSGPTPAGIRIGPVYTPPELRRHGYATTLVADLSARLLERGHRACFLYTDLANPTSNRIYLEIGYERVCDAMEFVFRAN
ncbi:MAG TPA: GNAT family N-acetyltransferase [Actinomycetota bacterium]|nr:GNAT family N-acetyltransferase [Actinomycetota bacterium]